MPQAFQAATHRNQLHIASQNNGKEDREQQHTHNAQAVAQLQNVIMLHRSKRGHEPGSVQGKGFLTVQPSLLVQRSFFI